MMHRRSFIQGIIAAPAIVKSASLMPIRGIVMPLYGIGPDRQLLMIYKAWQQLRMQRFQWYEQWTDYAPFMLAAD